VTKLSSKLTRFGVKEKISKEEEKEEEEEERERERERDILTYKQTDRKSE
jgi:hypothetical protein